MEVMIAVIIAGGSGTRLWPLSTPDYPKHLLKINGDSKSLLQNTYERITQLADDIYVISEAGHIHHVKAQLPDVPDDHFIVEPARRGTASCIVAALACIAKVHDLSEPVAFSPADHYIRDVEGFMHSFSVAAETAEREGRIVLVGVEPDYPATGFGYIEKAERLGSGAYAYQVRSFKEKPDYVTAQNYLKSGRYLWNAGYFVGSITSFTEAMQTHAPELAANYQKLLRANAKQYEKMYVGFKNEAIDYALIEKVPNLLVVPASFDWMDLGSFADLHKAVDSDERGNHLAGQVDVDEVGNSYVQNLEDKPVAVIGLDNVVVINSPNGMLVVRKDLSQKVGEVSKRLSDHK